MKKQHRSVRMCVGGTHTAVAKIDIGVMGGKNSTKIQPSLGRTIGDSNVLETKIELKLMQYFLCLEISSKDSRSNILSTDALKKISMEK